MVHRARTVSAILIVGMASIILVATAPASADSPTSWLEQAPATSPPPRAHASIAYDAGQLVLFGGLVNGAEALGDTWTWDGTNWTQQEPVSSPSARSDASMAYDPATHQLVLFGGEGPNDFYGDTWTWNGTNWFHQAPVNSPSARTDASMAFDAGTGQLVLFGGVYDGAEALDDTWTWDGTNWTKQALDLIRFDGQVACVDHAA
jgi:hypothetical protein